VAQRTRWEYRVETARVGTYVRDQAPAFNSLGEDGWELCGIRGYTIQEGEQSVQISEFYFKRPVQ
jgi:hypothetical protein